MGSEGSPLPKPLRNHPNRPELAPTESSSNPFLEPNPALTTTLKRPPL
jgi:hypothetical protein